jgi:IQ calmodulin-binding motif
MIHSVRLREQVHKRYFLQCIKSQLTIAKWYKSIQNSLWLRISLNESRRQRAAATHIQRVVRGMLGRKHSHKQQHVRALARCGWRRLYCRLKARPTSANMARARMLARLHIRRWRRRNAAVAIQAVWRGHALRAHMELRLATVYSAKAVVIQRYARGCMVRKRIAKQTALLNSSARTVTRAVRRRRAVVQRRKRARLANEQRVREEQARRVLALQRRAEDIAARDKLKQQEAAVCVIQAQWRAYISAKHAREQAVLQAMEDAAAAKLQLEKLAQLQAARDAAVASRARHGKAAQLARAIGLLRHNSSSNSSLAASLDSDSLDDASLHLDDTDVKSTATTVKRKDKGLLEGLVAGTSKAQKAAQKAADEQAAVGEMEMLKNAILNYQSASTTQEGICQLAFTVGVRELASFSEIQRYLARTSEPYLTRFDFDLSGTNDLKMFLWYRVGTGTGVYTSVRVDRAPGNHASSAIQKAREQTALQNGAVLIGHPKLDLELYCHTLSRNGTGAPVVDAITFVTKRSEAKRLLAQGYEKAQCELSLLKWSELSLAENQRESMLYIHRKTYKGRPERLSVANKRLRRHDWYTTRTAHTLERYALKETDVRAVRAIFQETDYSGDNSIAAYSFFTEIHEPDTLYARWLFRAVRASSADKLDWDEYFELVCIVGMFDRTGMLKFAFGQMDIEQKRYIELLPFTKLLHSIQQHDASLAGNFIATACIGFKKYAHYSEKLDYPGFEQLCKAYPRVPFALYKLQTAIQQRNLGQQFWDKRKEAFMAAREELGITLYN